MSPRVADPIGTLDSGNGAGTAPPAFNTGRDLVHELAIAQFGSGSLADLSVTPFLKAMPSVVDRAARTIPGSGTRAVIGRVEKTRRANGRWRSSLGLSAFRDRLSGLRIPQREALDDPRAVRQ